MSTEAKTNVGLIYQIIPAIMAEIPAITKDRKNAAQNYVFRGIDDVYAAVNPILAKHGVFMRAEVQDVKREERPSKSGGTMAFVQVNVRYYFVAKDGSSVSTDSLGEGMDSGDKATPKAMSIAQKYAILQMFCIPTVDPKDVENDDPDPVYTEPKITADQTLVINKLVDDKKRDMEDVEALIGKVRDYYKISEFPAELTQAQATQVINRWSKKAKS